VIHKHIDNRLLETSGEVGQRDLRPGLDVSNYSRFEAAEAEIECVADFRARESDRFRVASTSGLVDQRPTGIAQAHHAGAFIECLACGVVASSR
jgi:hypothetical protein